MGGSYGRCRCNAITAAGTRYEVRVQEPGIIKFRLQSMRGSLKGNALCLSPQAKGFTHATREGFHSREP